MEDNSQIIKRNIPRDVFLHLLTIVTLYWSAISFITLLWQYINYFFPDALNRYVYSAGFSGPIRFAVSSLIIVFPVFILVSRYLNKVYEREAQVRESKIRKWLIYLTLFITSLVIIGDLISTINIFLGGEITVRFVLKALSVLLVAGVVFGYYLDDVRRETTTKLAKYFAWATGAIVLITVVGAFFIIGSPTTARLMQFDQQRVNDLSNIQYQIVNYWQAKEKMPATLDDLTDPISGFFTPTDPETKANYEYIILDAEKLSFQLCATFSKEFDGKEASIKTSTPYLYDEQNQVWNHSSGRVCFERTIDKQLYPPINKTIK
jgi:hypothetical protein